MNKITLIFVLAASLALVGCGASSETTPDQDAAFKKGDKSAIKPPPPGANQAPAGFKSSLGGETGPQTHGPSTGAPK